MDPALPVPTAQGTFSKTPWAHLLVYAFDRRLTGTFELTREGVRVATILFVEGRPAKVLSTDGRHLLGHVMVELGHITQVQLAASLEHYKPDERAENPFASLHGEVLVQLGFVTPEVLTLGLVAQVERKVAQLFELSPDTTYAYFDGHDALTLHGGAPTPAHPYPILSRGLRESSADGRAEATLNGVQHMGFLLKNPQGSALFSIDDESRAILDDLATRPMRILDRLAAETGASRHAVGQLLYALVITKQVELVDPSLLPARADEAPVSPRGRAVARVTLEARMVSPGPLVAEEPPVPRNIHDTRISSPPVRAAGDSAFPGDPSRAWTPEAAPKGTPSPEDIALRQRVQERAHAMAGQDYFQMLGIGREASSEAIEKSFFALAKTWHPDRVPSHLADVKEATTKIFALLGKAHTTLADASSREAYLEQLREGGPGNPDDQAKVQAILDAATAFQKAEFFLKRNDVVAALEQAKIACDLDGEQADYLAIRTWLEFLSLKDPPHAELLEKIAVLDRCLVLQPKCENALFWRGQLYKRVDMTERAVHDFRRVAELFPRNLDAVREVRLYEMREARAGRSQPESTARPSRTSAPPPGGTKSGLLGRIFKKS